MQRVCEQLGIIPTETLEGKRISLACECALWKARMFFGNETNADFANVSGKWEHQHISLDVIEHPTALTSSSSDDEEGSAVSDLDSSCFENSMMVRQRMVPIDRKGRRTVASPAAGRRVPRPPRREDSKFVLQGKLAIAPFPDATTAASHTTSTATFAWREIDMLSIDTVFRFDVPQDRSIPFLLTPEELQLIKEDGSTSNSSNELPSTASLHATTAPTVPPAAIAISSIDTPRRNSVSNGSAPQSSATTPLRRQAMQAMTSIKQTVSKITTTSRIVYTCGSIGLKWRNHSGVWSFLAFRTTDECFRWVTLIRRVIVSQLFFQTFQEVFTLKLRFADSLSVARPDMAAMTDFFLAHDEHKMTKKKSKDPREPPGKGILTLFRGGAPNRWAVFMDEAAKPYPTSSRDVHQILHCFKVGKNMLDKPKNALLSFSVAKILSSSQDIHLRRTTIHVPMPFSNQFYFQQTNKYGVVRRIEAHAESMENRMAWEEYLQIFGAVKVLSDEEMDAQNNILGADEDWDALIAGETEAGVGEDGANNSPNERPRNRSLSRLGSAARTSPFQWILSKPQVFGSRASMTSTGVRRSPSSESLLSPSVKSPGNLNSSSRHLRTTSKVSIESIMTPSTRQESTGSRDFDELPPLPRSMQNRHHVSEVSPKSRGGVQYSLPAVLVREEVVSPSLMFGEEGSTSSSIVKFNNSLPASVDDQNLQPPNQQGPLADEDDPLAAHLNRVDSDSAELSISTPPLRSAPPLDIMGSPPPSETPPTIVVATDTAVVLHHHSEVPVPNDKLHDAAPADASIDVAEHSVLRFHPAEGGVGSSAIVTAAVSSSTPRTPHHSEITASPMVEDLAAAALELSVKSERSIVEIDAARGFLAAEQRQSPSVGRHSSTSSRQHPSALPAPSPTEEATLAWVAQHQAPITTPTTPGVLSNAPTNNNHHQRSSTSQQPHNESDTFQTMTMGHASRHFSSVLSALGGLRQANHNLRNISSLSGDMQQDELLTSQSFGPMMKSRSVFDESLWNAGKSVHEQKQDFRDSLQSFRGQDGGLDDLDRFSDATAPAFLRRRTTGGKNTSPETVEAAGSFPSGVLLEDMNNKRSSSLSSEDADLIALNPSLSGVLQKNMTSPRRGIRRDIKVCPLCNCDKQRVVICSSTGRKHATPTFSSPSPVRSSRLSHALYSPNHPRGAMSASRNDASPSNQPDIITSETRRNFARHVDESHEVVTARIFLELD